MSKELLRELFDVLTVCVAIADKDGYNIEHIFLEKILQLECARR